MRNNFANFVFAVVVIVAAGAAEEMLPKFFGTGFPLLLAASAFFASEVRSPAALVFAVAAGAMEDALSSLPVMTSSSAFFFAALAARYSGMPRATAVAAYPIYRLWLAVWSPSSAGNLYANLLASVPAGFVAAFAVAAALSYLRRKAALDEPS